MDLTLTVPKCLPLVPIQPRDMGVTLPPGGIWVLRGHFGPQFLDLEKVQK